jgi:hypothetical protein
LKEEFEFGWNPSNVIVEKSLLKDSRLDERAID